MQGLLRYPPPADGDARVLLLVQQASYLRENCTNFGGAFVRRQNQQVGAEGGIKTGSRAEEALYERRSDLPLSPGTISKQQGMTTAAIYDQGKTIAEGLYARSEALGINKALFSTIGELKVRPVIQCSEYALTICSRKASRPIRPNSQVPASRKSRQSQHGSRNPRETTPWRTRS